MFRVYLKVMFLMISNISCKNWC